MTDDKQIIDFGQAFTYVRDDPNWLRKLVIIAIFSGAAFMLIMGPLTLLALAFMPAELFTQLAEIDPRLSNLRTDPSWNLALPISGGLLLMALLLGYYIELVARMRTGQEHPLPPWDRWWDKLRDGAAMQVAYAAYLLSAGIFYAVGLWAIQSISGFNAELVQVVLAMCLLLPLFVVYLLGVIFVTSINVLPYTENRHLQDFFRLGWAWRRLRQDTGLTTRWFFYGVGANFGFAVAQSLPVIFIVGYLLSFFMTIPVQGHLLGQYGLALDDRHGDALAA